MNFNVIIHPPFSTRNKTSSIVSFSLKSTKNGKTANSRKPEMDEYRVNIKKKTEQVYNASVLKKLFLSKLYMIKQ